MNNHDGDNLYTSNDDLNFNNLLFLRKYLKLTATSGAYVAGGCFKNIFTNSKVKDIDIFFVTLADCKLGIHSYMRLVEDTSNNWVKVYENAKVYSCKDLDTGIRVELIKGLYLYPKDLLNEFDFTITQFAYFRSCLWNSGDEEGYTCLYSRDFFEHLVQRRLVIANLTYPVSTFERVLRYTKYGYGLCKN